MLDIPMKRLDYLCKRNAAARPNRKLKEEKKSCCEMVPPPPMYLEAMSRCKATGWENEITISHTHARTHAPTHAHTHTHTHTHPHMYICTHTGFRMFWGKWDRTKLQIKALIQTHICICVYKIIIQIQTSVSFKSTWSDWYLRRGLGPWLSYSFTRWKHKPEIKR